MKAFGSEVSVCRPTSSRVLGVRAVRLSRCVLDNFSPVQVVPIPVKPGLQAQLKDPGMLLHVALASQLCPPFGTHSLMSVKQCWKEKVKKKRLCLFLLICRSIQRKSVQKVEGSFSTSPA